MYQFLKIFAGEPLVPIRANEIGIPKIIGDGGTFDVIVGIVYTGIGAIALFYIVRGALLFIQANGDPGQINEAKNTVLYSVAALAMSTIVFSILRFVADKVGGV